MQRARFPSGIAGILFLELSVRSNTSSNSNIVQENSFFATYNDTNIPERRCIMTREVRTVVFDTDLQLEAYQFEGIMQKFPNHFHDYYVIGFIEQGKRHLVCNNEEYIL